MPEPPLKNLSLGLSKRRLVPDRPPVRVAESIRFHFSSPYGWRGCTSNVTFFEASAQFGKLTAGAQPSIKALPEPVEGALFSRMRNLTYTRWRYAVQINPWTPRLRKYLFTARLVHQTIPGQKKIRIVLEIVREPKFDRTTAFYESTAPSLHSLSFGSHFTPAVSYGDSGEFSGLYRSSGSVLGLFAETYQALKKVTAPLTLCSTLLRNSLQRPLSSTT